MNSTANSSNAVLLSILDNFAHSLGGENSYDAGVKSTQPPAAGQVTQAGLALRPGGFQPS
jgi:hypothetical protein